MRAGAWGGPISTDNARVWVNGVRRPVRSVNVQRGMRDGHPAAPTSASMCVTATIGWENPADVSADAPEPWSGDSWHPRDGDSVHIETGDGALGQWWTIHRGVIDSTTGTLEDGTATSRTVDGIDDLTSAVTIGALLARMTPASNSTTAFRQMGLSSTFLIDRVLRSCAGHWCATPPRTTQTIASATSQGSLWPEVGSLLSGHRLGDMGLSPQWTVTPYGVAGYGYVAEYAVADLADTPTPILSLGLHTVGSGIGRVNIVDADGYGAWLGHDRGTDDIVYGTTGTGSSTTYRMARNGATRAAIFFQRTGSGTQTLTVRASDGREVTVNPGVAIPSGWACSRVSVDGRAGIGWWLVEGAKPVAQKWFTLNHSPTAVLRINEQNWMVASPDMPWVDAAEWLTEQLEAELSAMWLNEDGVMQWRGRGNLESAPISQRVTTDLSVLSMGWETRRHAIAKNVTVTYEEPHVRAVTGTVSVDCWEEDSIDLGPGEEELITVSVPDDQDWIGVDMTTGLITGSTTPAQLRNGSKHGGTLYEDTDKEPGQAWATAGLSCTMTRVGLRAINVLVDVWSSVGGGHRIKTAIPDLDVVTSKLSRWHTGRAALRIRARAVTTWVKGERSRSAGTSGLSVFEHAIGWRLQRVSSTADSIRALLDDLAAIVSSTRPVAGPFVMEHDPRRQIGDVVRVSDPHVTGRWVDVIVQDITTDVAAFTDAIEGRTINSGAISGLTLLHPAGSSAITPPIEHTREVAS